MVFRGNQKSTTAHIPIDINIQNSAFKIDIRSRWVLEYYYCIHDQRKHIDKYLIYKTYRLTINNVTSRINWL
jgi:hypothetical protein